MFYKGKNVLVLGGAGMTGQSLIPKLLAEGSFVRATQYQRGRIALSHKNLEIVSCDLRDSEKAGELFQGMEIVFICAGIVRGAKGIEEEPSDILMYNLNLQSKLIHLAAKAKVERCSFVSSSYVYPHTDQPNVEGEGFQADPWKPKNYGMGWYHRYLETLCKHFHMTSGTRYAVVRPTVPYGPFDHFDLEDGHVVPASIMKAVQRMDPYEVWGNGQEVRSFTYVDDFSQGLMRSVESYAVGEAINICAKETATVYEMIRMVFDHLDFHPKVVFRADRPSAVAYKVSDPSKAEELLNWEAKVGLREGLGRTIDWYLKRSS